MKLFEYAWAENFYFYERYFDTDLDKSVMSKIEAPYEWYEESSNGLYTSILDSNIKLDKKCGYKARDGREHYGFIDPMYKTIRDNYWNKEHGYNNNPRIWYLDIETRVGTASNGFPVPDKAIEPISLMQFYDNKTEVMFVLGLRDWKHQDDYKFDYDVRYIKCNDEIHMLETFLNIFKKLDPLIIYAWNGRGFDYPYIYNRLKLLGMDPNRMSNYGSVKLTESEFMGKKEFKISAAGNMWLDLLDVYRKYGFGVVTSYSLDNIAEHELGERKVQHTEYAAFDDFYTGKYIIPTNPRPDQLESKIYQYAITHGVDDEVRELAHSEFVYYGIKDTYLIKRIDEKKNFTALMLMIAEKMGVTLYDTMGTVKAWSQYIGNKSYLDNKVLPPKTEHSEPHVVGGYVRDPVKGKHKWVLSADVNSMYPLLGMVGFNMSPETFIPKHKLPSDLKDIVLAHFNDQEESNRLTLNKDVWAKCTELLNKYNMSLGINGAVFSKNTEGMVPELINSIYRDRKQAKKTMFDYDKRKIMIDEIIKQKLYDKERGMSV